MTARRQSSGIKSMVEVGLRLLQPVRPLLVHARSVGISERRRLMRLCLEQLEDRITPSGGVTTINFDNLPDLTVVTSQYAAQGVTFSGASVLSEATASLNYTYFPPHSGNEVIYDDPSLGAGLITATATQGKWSDVGAYITGNRAITMTAYSVDGTVLGTRSTGGPNYTGVGVPNMLLEIKAPNIAYVTFHDTGNTFTVDDFFFSSEPVIPTKLQPNPDGSLVVTYQVLTQLQPGQQVPIGIYWATGPNGTDALSADSPHDQATGAGDALATYDVTSDDGPGTYTFTVPVSLLTTAAHEVKDLLVVADPDNNLSRQGDPSAVLAVPVQTDTLTPSELQQMMPNLSQASANVFAPALNEVMDDFGIASLEQRAMFLAQLDAESSGLTRWNELWTSRKNFQLPGVNRPPHTATSQLDYFDYWYGGRLGNGKSTYQGGTSNDGFTFRGRGPIQLTGRSNYQAFADYEQDPSIMTDPDQLGDKSDPLIGFESAAWYFNQRADLNTLTDDAAGEASTVFNRTITVAINGGTNGLATRLADYRLIRSILLNQNGSQNSDPLVVTTEPPTTVTAGTPFGLVVTAENANGTVNTSFNGSVTVADYYGYHLGGTLTVQAVNGVATFSGLTLDTAGTHYLYATTSGMATVYTSGFTVTAAPATKLVASAPSNVLANGPFNLSVDAEDQFGNIATTFNGNVTLALATNPGSAMLGGTLTVRAVNGVATFSGLSINNPGNGYTLQATSSSLEPGTTAPFNVSSDRLVATTQPPTTITAGTNFGLVVTAKNSLGNVDTTFNGSITLTLNNNNLYYGANLGGIVTVTAVNGVATFSGLTLNQIGNFSLSATSNGLLGATTNSFNVTAAAATQLLVSTPFGSLNNNGNILAGSPFVVEVTAEDPFGNVNPTFHGTVSLALANNTAGAALGGTIMVTAINGVATFSGVTIDKPGSGYVLLVTSAPLTAGSSPAFNVTNDQLVVTAQPPSSINAGSPFGLIVSAEDGQGNVDTSFNGSVTVALSNYSGGSSTLEGTVTVTAVNGVANFSGLMVGQAGSYALFVNANGAPGSVTTAFTVKDVPTKLLVTAQPPTTVTAGAGFRVEVSVEDASGNVDSSFNGAVTLALANNPNSGTLSGTVTVTAVNGVATFSGLTINNSGNGYTLQASATGLTSATTTAMDVTAVGVATQLVVTSQPPSSVTAGSVFGVVVTAEDDLGNVDTSFNGNVAIFDPFGNLLGQTTAANGVAAFTGLTLDQVGSYSLTVTSSNGLTVATSNFNVTPATATQLVIEGPEGNVLSGTPFALTVYGLDPFGNVDSSFNGSITLSLSENPGGALSGTLTAAAVNGVATFSDLTINNPSSSYIIQGASPGLAVGTTQPFEVTNDQLVVTTQPPSNITAGNGFGLVVAAENSSGNVDTSFNGSVTLTLTDNSGDVDNLAGTVTVTAVNGVASFSDLDADQANYYTLSASSNGLATTTTSAFNVNAAAATQLVVTTEPPANITTGTGFEVDLTAEDPYGNIDPTFNGTVTIALNSNPASGTLGGTLTTTAVGGEASFSGLTINNPGNSYSLQGSATGLTSATTSAVDVTAVGVATQLVVSSQPPSSVHAGSPFGLVVEAEDSFGTMDKSFNGTVTVTDPFGNLLGQTTAVNGVATFTGLTLEQTGDHSLTVTSGGLAEAVTNSIGVSPLAASQLLVMPPAGNVLPGSPFGLDVFATDQYGDVDPTFNGTVTLAAANNPGGATLAGPLTVTAVNGLANFSGLTINQPGVGYTLRATSTGLAAGISPPFDVTNDQWVITTQPPSIVTPGSPFDVGASVEDASGSVDSSFNGTVTVDLLNFNSNAPTLGGTVTVQAVNGVASFSGLTLNLSGSYVLSLTSAGLGGAFTNTIDVPILPATTVQLTSDQPTGAVYGQPITFITTVTSASSSALVPTGTVQFQINGSNYGAPVMLSAASASLSISSLPVGNTAVTAIYSGDSNHDGSDGTLSGGQTVNPAATTTSGSISGTQYFGQRLTFTATVSANKPSTATPTGSVDFFDTTTNDDLGTVSLANGAATLTTSALPLGTQTITLSYLGNTNFLAISSTVSVTIVPSIFILNPTASGTLNVSGKASISIPGAVIVDSNSKTAVTASGNTEVTAGSILVDGGVSQTGNATLNPAPSIGMAAVPDPLASLAGPSTTGVESYGTANYSSGVHTLQPGIYSQIMVSGNASLRLNPGVYIIEGGGVRVSGNGVISGTGVMLYNTSSQYPNAGGSIGSITLSGNGTLNLTAPASGPYAGVVIFQDRGNTQAITLSGNSLEEGTGNVVYAPSALMSLSGNADIQGALVVNELALSGNADPSDVIRVMLTPELVLQTNTEVRGAFHDILAASPLPGLTMVGLHMPAETEQATENSAFLADDTISDLLYATLALQRESGNAATSMLIAVAPSLAFVTIPSGPSLTQYIERSLSYLVEQSSQYLLVASPLEEDMVAATPYLSPAPDAGAYVTRDASLEEPYAGTIHERPPACKSFEPMGSDKVSRSIQTPVENIQLSQTTEPQTTGGRSATLMGGAGAIVIVAGWHTQHPVETSTELRNRQSRLV